MSEDAIVVLALIGAYVVTISVALTMRHGELRGGSSKVKPSRPWPAPPQRSDGTWHIEQRRGYQPTIDVDKTHPPQGGKPPRGAVTQLDDGIRVAREKETP